MAFQNAPIQGLALQGTADSYYFEQSRDLRSIGVPLTGLTYVHSFTIKENNALIYNAPTFVLGNAQWGCRVNPSSSMRVWFEFWYNGSFVTDLAVNFNSSTPYCYITLFAGIDESNQKATIFLGTNYDSYDEYYDGSYDGSQHFTNTNYCYQWLQGHIAPQYNWQSVSSISGKNGILNLAQIKAESINDGEPVSGASDSAFTNMSDDNNVATLVDVGELNNNKAKVVYNIPALTSGNYSYAKLVYKQGFIPTSKDDGTAVDLDLTDLGTNKTITVSNIVSGSVYWFVIFTDKSESDAVSLGENTEGVFFELDLTTDGRDVIRYNPAKEFLGAKQGELVGNNFTISDGVLDTSYDVSWYYDPAENPKSIPADCTLTFEYDTFFPNGEGYLDWYIIDSDDTQRIYWCFDTQYAFQSNKWYNCKTVAKVENGKITRYKYVLDDVEISCSTANIKMPCTDASDSVGIEDIHFRLTRPTKMKNISIYYDFSTYTDGSGGGGSGGSGASGSNPVS